MVLTAPNLAMSPTQALGLEDILAKKRLEAQQLGQATVNAAHTTAQGQLNAANLTAQGIQNKGQADAAGMLSISDAVNNFFARLDAQKAQQQAMALEQAKYITGKQDELAKEERANQRKIEEEDRASKRKDADREKDAEKEIRVYLAKQRNKSGGDKRPTKSGYSESIYSQNLDLIRNIDTRPTAKTGKPMTKEEQVSFLDKMEAKIAKDFKWSTPDAVRQISYIRKKRAMITGESSGGDTFIFNENSSNGSE